MRGAIIITAVVLAFALALSRGRQPDTDILPTQPLPAGGRKTSNAAEDQRMYLPGLQWNGLPEIVAGFWAGMLTTNGASFDHVKAERYRSRFEARPEDS
ncbi:hypothetical protein HAP48_0004620 [Bradyrhizobium septentrionale]|uniref:Uncharacterized protein n=1 Tax=Bradyrhizobium septentrionale TaxID=1404411 RepID=A0A974A385_9BRAD|nr:MULTISPECIES: hypothetical protein [Bradyrhizobium]UGY16821.1 hypothetical protein HAP48_0004620 [Bradyrhizobium septentrionale]UGY25421.1 hypothetical protein HU675_0000165 [Bradyrhizobium septentrionale]